MLSNMLSLLDVRGHFERYLLNGKELKVAGQMICCHCCDLCRRLGEPIHAHVLQSPCSYQSGDIMSNNSTNSPLSKRMEVCFGESFRLIENWLPIMRLKAKYTQGIISFCHLQRAIRSPRGQALCTCIPRAWIRLWSSLYYHRLLIRHRNCTFAIPSPLILL